MSKQSRGFVKGAAAVLGGWLLLRGVRRVSALKTLMFNIVDVQIPNYNSVNVTIQISNPQPVTVTLNALNVELYFNGINIGRVYMNKALTINRNTSAAYIFPAILYPLGEAQLLLQMFRTKAQAGLFTINGFAYFNNLQLPVQKQYKLW